MFSCDSLTNRKLSKTVASSTLFCAHRRSASDTRSNAKKQENKKMKIIYCTSLLAFYLKDAILLYQPLHSKYVTTRILLDTAVVPEWWLLPIKQLLHSKYVTTRILLNTAVVPEWWLLPIKVHYKPSRV